MSWDRIRILIWKEFQQLKRDRSMLPILFVMPIIQLVLFGYVVGSDIQNLQLAVLDNDHSAQSRRVVEAFTSSSDFHLSTRCQNEADVKRALDGGKAAVAIEIPKGLGDAVRQGRPAQIGVVVDGSDSRVSGVGNGYSAAIISSLNTELYPQRGGGSQTGASTGGTVDAQVRVIYNPAMRAVNTMVPALLALILLMSTQNLMAMAIVKERERGALEQLFVTPIGRTEYLLGKLLPYAGVAFVQVAVTFVVGTLWFRVPYRGSVLVLAGGLMLFMLAALGLGMIVSLLSQTRQQAQQTSMLLQMPQMMLSGFMFPIDAFPHWLYNVTYLIPLRYILVIVRSDFLKGSDFSALWMHFAGLGLFSVGIFLFGLSKFHKRLSD
jgi:ABC-2 type transport system permease protein